MLEASILSYHHTLDVIGLVYPSQLDLDKYSNHPLSCLESYEACPNDCMLYRHEYEEHEITPIPLTDQQVLERVEDINTIFGKT